MIRPRLELIQRKVNTPSSSLGRWRQKLRELQQFFSEIGIDQYLESHKKGITAVPKGMTRVSPMAKSGFLKIRNISTKPELTRQTKTDLLRGVDQV